MSVLPDIEQQSGISSATSATGEYTYQTLHEQYPTIPSNLVQPLRSFLQGAVWSATSKPMLEWILHRGGRTVSRKYHPQTGTTEKLPDPDSRFPIVRNEQYSNCNDQQDDDPIVTVRIGTGSGQPSTPFSVSSEAVTSLFREYGFSPRFLRKLKGKAALFEHLFSKRDLATNERDKTNPNPDTVELAFSSFEVNSLHIFGIHHIPTQKSHFLIFLKTSTFFQPRRVWSWLEESSDILSSNPILVPNIITSGLQLYVHSFGTWHALVNDMEARIGVTTEIKLLETQGFTKESQDLVMLNNSLSTLKKIIAEHELAAATMVKQTKSFMRIIELVEQLDRAANGTQSVPTVSEACEELHGTVTRAEIYLQNLQIMQNILQNHTAALYNRINQHDNSLNLAVSQSMKTIAVVTLLYLPPTFVATLFSTSIFDFGAERHVSNYWWVLATICILLTLITLVMWALWYKWGRQWTDSLLALTYKKE